MHSTEQPGSGDVLAVSAEDFLWFVDLALDTMAGVVRDLGDELANRRPDLEGANSPFAILTHCLGVMEYWGGATVAGRPIVRDRAAEFVATGSVEELLGRTVAARQQLESDLADLVPAEVPSNVKHHDDAVPYTMSKGAVLLHVLEELFQHAGQMELTRDLLLAERRAAP